jgi:hypothetical protein
MALQINAPSLSVHRHGIDDDAVKVEDECKARGYQAKA